MTRRFVDLSIYLENDVLSDPPLLAPKITYQKHQDTLPEFMAMIPGGAPLSFTPIQVPPPCSLGARIARPLR